VLEVGRVSLRAGQGVEEMESRMGVSSHELVRQKGRPEA
jgi:hypothetical protein